MATTSVTGTTKVTGALTATVSDPSVILNNASVKSAFEGNMQGVIATSAKVATNAVSVTASEGSRRLESAEPRQLAGTIRIDYTITTTSTNSANVIQNINAGTNDA